jgi:hypothetical protein
MQFSVRGSSNASSQSRTFELAAGLRNLFSCSRIPDAMQQREVILREQPGLVAIAAIGLEARHWVGDQAKHSSANQSCHCRSPVLFSRRHDTFLHASLRRPMGSTARK